MLLSPIQRTHWCENPLIQLLYTITLSNKSNSINRLLCYMGYQQTSTAKKATATGLNSTNNNKIFTNEATTPASNANTTNTSNTSNTNTGTNKRNKK